MQIAGYLPIARKKLLYVYAAFLEGKNSLNVDSGSSCSTVLTLGGVFGDPGAMASTSALSKVQEVDSRRAWISDGNGSDEELPHKVPEQLTAAAISIKDITSDIRSLKRSKEWYGAYFEEKEKAGPSPGEMFARSSLGWRRRRRLAVR